MMCFPEAETGFMLMCLRCQDLFPPYRTNAPTWHPQTQITPNVTQV